MCKIIINQVKQFGCRIQGYEVLDTLKGEILGMTETDIKKSIEKGELILGLKMNHDAEELVLDEEGFCQTDIMVKTTLKSMKPLNNEEAAVNVFFTLIGVKDSKDGRYELMNSRFGRSEVSIDKLMTLLEMGLIQGGCKLDGNGNLKLAKVFEDSIAKKESKPRKEIPADKKEAQAS